MNYLFYRCNHCGHITSGLECEDAPYCCGEQMCLLEPNLGEGAFEKHIPVIEQNGNSVLVKVGSVPHPMLNEHYIEKIFLITDKRILEADLLPGNKPEATFTLTDQEKAISAYEYCNLHGFYQK